MKKTTLTITNLLLVALLILSAASSIILESAGGEDLRLIRNSALVVAHITVTLILFAVAYNHVKLHFGSFSRWPSFFKKTKRQNRWLFWMVVVTLMTGILAIFTYSIHGHSPLGAIHGKIGFLALVLMFLHLLHRRHWFGTFRHMKRKM